MVVHSVILSSQRLSLHTRKVKESKILGNNKSFVAFIA